LKRFFGKPRQRSTIALFPVAYENTLSADECKMYSILCVWATFTTIKTGGVTPIFGRAIFFQARYPKLLRVAAAEVQVATYIDLYFA